MTGDRRSGVREVSLVAVAPFPLEDGNGSTPGSKRR